MPVFNLTALPGHHEHTNGQAYTVTVVELLGDVLGRARIEAKTVGEIAAHVRQFGDSVAARLPDTSFMVSVSIARGCRKPRGFDDANRRNGLGQQAWMKTIEKADRSNPGLAA